MFKIDSNKAIHITRGDIGTIEFSASNSGVPDNCLIIVKDATQKAWVNEKFARLTNVKTVAEYEQ